MVRHLCEAYMISLTLRLGGRATESNGSKERESVSIWEYHFQNR